MFAEHPLDDAVRAARAIATNRRRVGYVRPPFPLLGLSLAADVLPALNH